MGDALKKCGAIMQNPNATEADQSKVVADVKESARIVEKDFELISNAIPMAVN